MRAAASVPSKVAMLFVATLMVGLVACSPGGDKSVPAPGVMRAPAAAAPSPSAPDATPKAGDVFKDGAATENKAAMNEQQKDPMRTMTKREESTAMPMAGQANDHSTLATEKGKK